MRGYNADIILLQNTLNNGNLEPVQLDRLIYSTLTDKKITQECRQNRIRIIAAHVTKRLSDLVPVTTLIETIHSPEQTLPDNLQTVLMSKNFLGLRKILKHLISSEETKDFLSRGFIGSSRGLLKIFENLEKKHSPTHIATRIKELIVGQGISAEDFSSLIWEELQRHREIPLPEQSYQTLLQAVNQEFESIDQKFQYTQQQEDLPIEKKLGNLLEKTEFIDLVEILTHLPLDTPNNDTAHVMLDFLVMALSSVDFQQPPLETETTPTPTPIQKTVLLPPLNPQRTAS